jgi:tight adherence protein C
MFLLSGKLVVWYVIVCFFIGLYFPNFWLKRRVRRRKRAITLALPDALDMMSICVDAGLGFEAAIQKIASQWENELATEFRRMIHELRMGVDRSKAMHHMVERTGVPDVASFAAVLIQADQLGISIRDVLKSQSKQMRIKRRQRAEEQAQKVPIKMLFPLIVFIFPSMFMIILGPAAVRFVEAFR